MQSRPQSRLYPGWSTQTAVHGPRRSPLRKSAAFFRNTPRPDRWPIEGKCSICHEDFKEDTEELTRCSACGGNFHYTCLENWKLQIAARPANCPLCRQPCTEPAPSTHRFDSIEGGALELYIDWLWYRTISVESSDEGVAGSSDKFGRLPDAYILGQRVDDQTFCKQCCSPSSKQVSGAMSTPHQHDR